MNDNETELKKSHAHNSDLAERSAWAIIIGLFIEVLIPLILSPPKSALLRVLVALPNVIIGLGVWGEIGFGGRARRAADSLQELSEQKVAEANARAAEANEKAEEARLARVKIEARLAPRHLSTEQQASITKHLAQWAILPGTDNKQSVAIFPTSNTFESAQLAEEIAVALLAAGWDVNRNEVHHGMPISAQGVWTLASSNARGFGLAAEIARVLTANGVLSFPRMERRLGCEEQGMSEEDIGKNPWCSQVSVFVGDHPA